MLDDVLAVAAALVTEAGMEPGAAVCHLSGPISVLWSARGGPTLLETDPEAMPKDRAALAALGYAVAPSDVTLAEALGIAAPDGGEGDV